MKDVRHKIPPTERHQYRRKISGTKWRYNKWIIQSCQSRVDLDGEIMHEEISHLISLWRTMHVEMDQIISRLLQYQQLFSQRKHTISMDRISHVDRIWTLHKPENSKYTILSRQRHRQHFLEHLAHVGKGPKKTRTGRMPPQKYNDVLLAANNGKNRNNNSALKDFFRLFQGTCESNYDCNRPMAIVCCALASNSSVWGKDGKESLWRIFHDTDSSDYWLNPLTREETTEGRYK